MNFARFNDVDAIARGCMHMPLPAWSRVAQRDWIQNSLFFGSEALRVLSLEAALDNLGIAENGSWEVSVSPNLKLNTMIRFKRCRNSKTLPANRDQTVFPKTEHGMRMCV